MIVVDINRQGITVDGHANYAEIGKDIICSAVSVLTFNLISSIEALTEDTIEYQAEEPGHINIYFKNLSEKGKLLVDSYFIGISSIIESYGEAYVSFKDTVSNGR